MNASPNLQNALGVKARRLSGSYRSPVSEPAHFCSIRRRDRFLAHRQTDGREFHLSDPPARCCRGDVSRLRAEQCAVSLQSFLKIYAIVIRDGASRHIPAEGSVAGDICSLGAGSHVPAELHLLTTNALSIDESSLTGKSTSVTKQAVSIEQEDVPLNESTWAAQETMVMAGVAWALWWRWAWHGCRKG